MEQVTGRPFSEVEDQPAFATRFDLRQAREHSPSFDDFCREVERLLRSDLPGQGETGAFLRRNG